MYPRRHLDAIVSNLLSQYVRVHLQTAYSPTEPVEWRASDCRLLLNLCSADWLIASCPRPSSARAYIQARKSAKTQCNKMCHIKISESSTRLRTLLAWLAPSDFRVVPPISNGFDSTHLL